jgi:formyl-CoA transferase
MQNVAPKLSETPGGIHSPAPEMAQHNDEVYRSLLGFDEARMQALKSKKVI